MMAYFQTEEQAMGGLRACDGACTLRQDGCGDPVHPQCHPAGLLPWHAPGKTGDKGRGQRAIRQALWVLREKRRAPGGLQPRRLEGACWKPGCSQPKKTLCGGPAAARPRWPCWQTGAAARADMAVPEDPGGSDVLRCARLLAWRVRYLTVRAPVGGPGGRIVRRIRHCPAAERATGIQPAVPVPGRRPGRRRDHPLDGQADGGLLALAPNGPGNRSPAGLADTLYGALLLQSGLLRPEEIGWSLKNHA